MNMYICIFIYLACIKHTHNSTADISLSLYIHSYTYAVYMLMCMYGKEAKVGRTQSYRTALLGQTRMAMSCKPCAQAAAQIQPG